MAAISEEKTVDFGLLYDVKLKKIGKSILLQAWVGSLVAGG